MSQPPYVEFNPMDRAYGYVLPSNIDENGSIITSSAEGFLPIESFESWKAIIHFLVLNLWTHKVLVFKMVLAHQGKLFWKMEKFRLLK